MWEGRKEGSVKGRRRREGRVGRQKKSMGERDKEEEGSVTGPEEEVSVAG